MARRLQLLMALVLVGTVAVHAGAAASRGTSPFGVEISRGQVARFAERATEASLSWVRYSGPRWNEVEPTPPVASADVVWGHHYNEGPFALSDRELGHLAELGLTPVVVLQGTPGWAVD